MEVDGETVKIWIVDGDLISKNGASDTKLSRVKMCIPAPWSDYISLYRDQTMAANDMTWEDLKKCLLFNHCGTNKSFDVNNPCGENYSAFKKIFVRFSRFCCCRAVPYPYFQFFGQYDTKIMNRYRVFRNCLRTLPAIFDIENVDENC